MGKTTKLKEQLLQDTSVELLLKSYLYRMEKFMGEEFTVLTLSAEKDIVESLNKFTTKFENVESNEIAFILVKSALLTNQKDYYIDVVKAKVEFGELQDILYLINENYGFRKSLTRNLMINSNKTDVELYKQLNDNDKVINELDTLKFYEKNLKEKIEERKIKSL